MGLDQAYYLSYFEILGESGLLGSNSYRGTGGRFCWVTSEEPGGSLVGSALAEEDVHRGGLAGPVGSQQGNQLTPFHPEIHVLERFDRPVTLSYVVEFCDKHDASSNDLFLAVMTRRVGVGDSQSTRRGWLCGFEIVASPAMCSCACWYGWMARLQDFSETCEPRPLSQP